MARPACAKPRVLPVPVGAGIHLRQLRSGGGLSQEEVAENMRRRGYPAITQSFVCRVEAGKKKTSAKMIAEIAAVIVAIVDERYRAVHELLMG